MSQKSFHQISDFVPVVPRSIYGTLILKMIVITSYFVEVIVKRPSFFARNHVQLTPLIFLPLEPIRQPPLTHQLFLGKLVSGNRGILDALLKRRSIAIGDCGIVTFEAKLPNPAIIKCTEPFPLSFVVKRTSASIDIVRIESIRITLHTITYMEIHESRREITSTSTILRKSKLGIILPSEDDELVINPSDFTAHRRGIYLPSTLIPSFRICNIIRKYDLALEMQVRPDTAKKAQLIRAIVEVQVYPGLKPLETTAASIPSPPIAQIAERSPRPPLANEEPPSYYDVEYTNQRSS